MSDWVYGTCDIGRWPGSNEMLLTLPGVFCDHLKLFGKKDKVVLWAGNRRTVGEVVFTEEEEVQMTDALRESLFLPLGAITAKVRNGQLHFGPFVGLYALPSEEPGRPFGELTILLQDMMEQAAEQAVSLYVFRPGEVPWESGYAIAYVYKTQQKRWIRTKRPLPDLVLPKILGLPQEWREAIRYDQIQMSRLVPFGQFSHDTGNKWEVYCALKAHEETVALLPNTRLVQKPGDIEQMLLQHRAIFIKPSYGTQGRSIYKLELIPNGVRLQYTQGGKTIVKLVRRNHPKWEGFLERKFCAKRKFLVQQALNLVAVQGVRPVDFRWLVQKDGDNQWHVTARVARVGNTGSITTNLHTGGDAILAEEFLRLHRSMERTEVEVLIERMDEAALEVAAQLEEKAGPIGELGIDLGLTKENEVYLIEVNPRPGRQMLKLTSPKIRALSLRRNIEYAKYTTGYQTPE